MTIIVYFINNDDPRDFANCSARTGPAGELIVHQFDSDTTIPRPVALYAPGVWRSVIVEEMP